jgi:thioredoxin 1
MQGSTRGFNPEYSENAPTLEQVSNLQGDALLEFGAPWCGHCRAALSGVKEVRSEHPDLLHIKIHDGKGQPLGRAFAVRRWPALILLHDGHEVARLVRPTQASEVRQLLAARVA